MKTKRCEKIFFNLNKLLMVHVTVFWLTENEHFNFAKLVYSVKTPAQICQLQNQHIIINFSVEDSKWFKS